MPKSKYVHELKVAEVDGDIAVSSFNLASRYALARLPVYGKSKGKSLSLAGCSQSIKAATTGTGTPDASAGS